MNMGLKLKTFRGGVHPKEFKKLTQNLPFEYLPTPEIVILPLSQHIGVEARPLVKKGDHVILGQLIAQAEGLISVPIHSSVTGDVLNIGNEITPAGYPRNSIVIKTTENSTEEKFSLPPLNPDSVTPEEIRYRVKEAGIVGMGGAAFPTYVKLTPQKDKPIDLVIINGCECEPYLTRDYRLMIEFPDELISGIKLIMKAVNVNKCFIGIDDNKPEAIKILAEKVKGEKEIEVIPLKTKYPQGAEKMLIKSITGMEVPPGKLPLDVGVVVQNVATAIAIHNAVVNGMPLTTAALTVSGLGIRKPKNLIVPIGTPIQDVINFCGGTTEDAVKIIVGGPMMGVAQYDLRAPVTKATSGILVLTNKEVINREGNSCLKCGKCVQVCPLKLMPTLLARYTQLKRYEDAEAGGITVCMECGTCAFTCPANIPLVQWIKVGKKKVLEMQKERITKQC